MLPLCLSAHAQYGPGTPQGAASLDAHAPVPSRWRDYALSSITPRFAWATSAGAVDVPQVTDAAVDVRSVTFALDLFESNGGAAIAVGVARQTVDQRVPVLAAPVVDVSAELPRFGLQRTIVAPSYVRPWGNAGAIGVTAVLAYQRFATLGFGEVSLRDDAMFWPTMAGESSYGGGLRVDADNAFGDRLRWNAAYQSRVNMDALNSYRGVYSDPGQFDLPASLSVGLSYALTRALSFDVGVQRVMYSEVTPFTSTALPRRFLALLGTGASPEFAWQDLDVYSAGWTWRNATVGNVELRYTTRQQPSPTSALLATALDANPQDHTVGLGYSRATGRYASISMQAVYSSAPYFLGVPSYRARTDSKGSNVEVEALWALRF